MRPPFARLEPTMSERAKNLYVGIGAIVLAIVLFCASYTIHEMSRNRLGADFMPRVTAVVLCLLGVMQTIGALRSPSAAQAAPQPQKTPIGFCGMPAVLANIALFAAYLLAMPHAGFIVCSAVYLFLQILIHTDPAKYALGRFALLSAGVAVATFYAFQKLFQVYLPAGWLG